jgi:multiple antibiotic resistance protein
MRSKFCVNCTAAFPLIAGAGTMTTLLSLKSQFDTVNIIIAIILNIIIVYIVLKSSSKNRTHARRKRIRSHQEDIWRGALAIAVKLFC